jgi:hypothetical protein
MRAVTGRRACRAGRRRGGKPPRRSPAGSGSAAVARPPRTPPAKGTAPSAGPARPPSDAPRATVTHGAAAPEGPEGAVVPATPRALRLVRPIRQGNRPSAPSPAPPDDASTRQKVRAGCGRFWRWGEVFARFLARGGKARGIRGLRRVSQGDEAGIVPGAGRVWLRCPLPAAKRGEGMARPLSQAQPHLSPAGRGEAKPPAAQRLSARCGGRRAG